MVRIFHSDGHRVFDHPRSVGYVGESLARWTRQDQVQDALFTFAEDLQARRCDPFGETVALTPLIATHRAVLDALEAPTDSEHQTAQNNRAELVAAASAGRWKPLVAHQDFDTHILLLQSCQRKRCEQSPGS